MVAELIYCNCVLSADISATDFPSKPPVGLEKRTYLADSRGISPSNLDY